MQMQFKLVGESKTEAFGKKIAQWLLKILEKKNQALTINLEGDLGAGKTTFCRGLIKACGFDGIVRSPTYTLVEEYSFSDFFIYHFDMYRLLDPEELSYMGVRDYFAKKGLCLIEWPDKAAGFIPKADVVISFTYGDDGGKSRSVVVKSNLIDSFTLN